MVTLTVCTNLSEERFLTEIEIPARKQLSHIKLVRQPQTAEADIYLLRFDELVDMYEQGKCIDFRSFADWPAMSSGRFEPNLLAWGEAADGTVYALPYDNGMEYPLVFNKHWFDRLDIPYPRDGMTWDEIIELAERVGSRADGQRIHALDPADMALMRMQLAVHYVDPITGQPNLPHEDWLRIARTLKSIYNIPGNILPEAKRLLRFNGYFVRDRSVAMGVICSSCFEPEALVFDWDITSYPVYDDSPGCSPNVPGLGVAIGASCAEPAAAYEVAATFVSDEHQLRNARSGIRPSIMNPLVRLEFGANIPFYEGKNVAALSKHSPAIPLKNKRERISNNSSLFREGLMDMFATGVDEETALRNILNKMNAVQI